MRRLKLFAEKFLRRATLDRLKLKLISLPVIQYIVSWYYAYKMHKNMQNMSRWDQYVVRKSLENNSREIQFIAALIRLEICIMAEDDNKELFDEAKSEVLFNEIINQAEYKDFKEWLEGIDSSEKDYSRLQKLINSLNQKTKC